MSTLSCKSIPTPLLCEFWFPEKKIVVSSLVVQPFPVHLISEIPTMSNNLLCLATLVHCAYIPCYNFCCCFCVERLGLGHMISILLQMDPSPRCKKCRFCSFILVSVVSKFFVGYGYRPYAQPSSFL